MYLDIFTSVKSCDLNIELLTVSEDNISNLCGLELKDICIQREFNFIGKEPNYYTGKENDIYSKEFNFDLDRPVVIYINLIFVYYYQVNLLFH